MSRFRFRVLDGQAGRVLRSAADKKDDIDKATERPETRFAPGIGPGFIKTIVDSETLTSGLLGLNDEADGWRRDDWGVQDETPHRVDTRLEKLTKNKEILKINKEQFGS